MRAPIPDMATSRMKWMLAAIFVAILFSAQSAESSRFLSDETALDHSGRSLLQTCWPGMRLNCDYNTQVVCEVGGVGECSCSAMEANLPEVSGCYVVVDGVATKSCGF